MLTNHTVNTMEMKYVYEIFVLKTERKIMEDNIKTYLKKYMVSVVGFFNWLRI
jgi:hypothetical protein